MNRKRRATFGALMGIFATGATLAVGASPAAAAHNWLQCYSNGSYSFINEPGNATTINIYSGTHCDTLMGDAWAWTFNNGTVELGVKDKKCDNKGFQVRVHGYTVSTTGCNEEQTKTVALSSIGSPKNFWAFVNGTTNSDALDIPTP